VAQRRDKRRGDAADALFREMKRRIAATLKKPGAMAERPLRKAVAGESGTGSR
jgi:hypothetical protein